MEKVILGGYYFDERKCRPKIEILRRILKGKQETIERNEKRIIELKSENNRLQSEIESISEKIEKKENRAKQKKKIKI